MALIARMAVSAASKLLVRPTLVPVVAARTIATSLAVSLEGASNDHAARMAKAQLDKAEAEAAKARAEAAEAAARTATANAVAAEAGAMEKAARMFKEEEAAKAKEEAAKAKEEAAKAKATRAIEEIKAIRKKFVTPILLFMLALDYVWHEDERFIGWRMARKLRVCDPAAFGAAPQNSLKVEPILLDEVFFNVVLGPSGCGKSTGLRTLARKCAKQGTPVILVGIRSPDTRDTREMSATDQEAVARLDNLAARIYEQVGYPKRRALVLLLGSVVKAWGPVAVAYSVETARLNKALGLLVKTACEVSAERKAAAKDARRQAANEAAADAATKAAAAAAATAAAGAATKAAAEATDNATAARAAADNAKAAASAASTAATKAAAEAAAKAAEAAAIKAMTQATAKAAAEDSAKAAAMAATEAAAAARADASAKAAAVDTPDISELPVLLFDEVEDLVKDKRLAAVGGAAVFRELTTRLATAIVDNEPMIVAAIAGSSSRLQIELPQTASGNRVRPVRVLDPAPEDVKVALIDRGYTPVEAAAMLKLCGPRLRLLKGPLAAKNRPPFDKFNADLVAMAGDDIRKVKKYFLAAGKSNADFVAVVERIEASYTGGAPVKEDSLEGIDLSPMLYVGMHANVLFQSDLHRQVWPTIRREFQ